MAWSEWLFYSKFDTYGIMKPSKLHFQSYSYLPFRGHGLILKENELFAYYSELGPDELPVEYPGGPNPYVKIPEPSQEMWDKFYQVLSDLMIKSWEKKYVNLDIIDGGGWEFKIRFKDIHRTTSGMNAYPKKILLDGKKIKPYDKLNEALDELSSGIFEETYKNNDWY